MPDRTTFKDFAIVACGTLAPELKFLRKSGFLDAKKILYTKPGRHEVPVELENLLVKNIRLAAGQTDKIIVVYGGKFCYVNTADPQKTIDTVIQQATNDAIATRIDASHCVDMLASKEDREQIGRGKKVWWLTPGWIAYRRFVFQDWDKGKANENFPQHTGGAILLDGVGFWDQFAATKPEQLLDFSDWMGIPIEPHPVSLDRLKGLLLDCVNRT